MENQTNEKKMYGWYSHNQKYQEQPLRDDSQGEMRQSPISSIYLKPNGEEIEITEVSSTKKYRSNWKDVKFVGEVTKWVRSIYK
tara:strand:+ start:289 stop:540 length:252 start_codon:yes stop_codon:yes gene_type:complete